MARGSGSAGSRPRSVPARSAPALGEDALAGHPRLPVARFGKLVNLTIKRLLEAHDCPVTREQEIVLRKLRESDGLPQVELATRVGQDRNNLSRTLQLLERNGFVRRTVDVADKRCSLVCITAEGRRVHDVAFAAIMAYQKVLFAGLPNDEIAAFAETMAHMTDNLARFLDTDTMDDR